MHRRLAPFLLAAAALPAPVAPARGAEPPAFDHVLIVSVDGLRGDAVAMRMSEPGAFRDLAGGVFTLNARCDAHTSVTLPNHVGMVTGRPLLGDGGHGWSANGINYQRRVLHDHHGAYVSGIFDVAHADGVVTGVFATKPKMHLFRYSWHERGPAAGGPGDEPPLDVFFDAAAGGGGTAGENRRLTGAVAAHLAAAEGRTLSLVHYSGPDRAGHASGWIMDPGSAYLEAVAEVDTELAKLLALIAAHDHLRGRTAVVVTADHGGGFPRKRHSRTDRPVNYTVPFLVWGGDRLGPADLYALNADTRADPGRRRRAQGTSLPPVRNADAANLALDLLGLPAVPGSTINAGQDLRVTAAPTGSTAPADTTPAP
ncbi:MAG: alkaline phosphatase family protein [Planctomycetota bacterium]|jgi:hypothetical protein